MNVSVFSSYEEFDYWLVKFLKSGEFEVVPVTWIISNSSCYYANSFRDEKDRREKVKSLSHAFPKKNFRKYDVKLVSGSC